MRPANYNMAIGKHYFDGACVPRVDGYCRWETFSLGIFEAVSGSRGVKRGKVKVRVKGYTSQPAAAFIVAKEIVTLLNAGKYNGPKNVDAQKWTTP